MGNFSFTLAYVTLGQGVAYVDARYDEQLSNLREPLREGAPKAIIPKRLSSTTLLSLLSFKKPSQGALRAEPPRRYIPGLLPHQSLLIIFFARAIEAAHGVRSFPQEEKTRKLDDKREERPCEQRSWGASLAKGLRTMGKKIVVYKHIRKVTNVFVNSRKLLVKAK